jgi:deoxycytidylate deaminase
MTVWSTCTASSSSLPQLPGLPPLPPPLSDPDLRWLMQARSYAAQSVDPLLRSGAIAVRGSRCLLGSTDDMPEGVRSTAARRRAAHTRQGMVLPAEQALVASAARHGIALQGATCYLWPFLSAAAGAALLIQAGCLALVAPELPLPARLEGKLLMVREMAAEAGVLLRMVDVPLLAEDLHG